MKKTTLTILMLLSFNTFAAYEDHFPAYFEYCSGSQWKTKIGKAGGPAGHGFTYIHGLCKDYSQKYPQVLPCDQVSSEYREKYPHQGVGISLDSYYSNATWAAIPGREFLMNGNVGRKSITKADIDKHIQKVTELRIFEGVKLNPKSFNNLTLDTPKYLEEAARATLGTDHAVNWARELHCVKIPVEKKKLKDVAKFLNEANLYYKNGHEYKWSMIYNNCAHLAINTGHALGINKPIKTDEFILKQITDLAVPGNVFMMYADLAVLDKPKATASYSPLQVGSLLAHYPAYESGYLFDTTSLKEMTLWRVMKPLKLFMTPRKYIKFNTPENSQLKANAAKWRKIYSDLLMRAKRHEVFMNLEKQLILTEKILKTE